MELVSTQQAAEGSVIQALGDDRTAVKAFLGRLALGPLGTERAYVKEVRRLLAWLAYAGYSVGHSLAQMTGEDMQAFFAFLRSGTALSKPEEDGGYWKKASPLAAASLEQVKSRLHVFFEMLENYEVAPGVMFRSSNPLKALGRVAAVRREARGPGERVELEGEEGLEYVLPVEDVQFVMRSIERMPRQTAREVAHYERDRWVFHLAYYSWFRISELARLQMGDFEFKDGFGRYMSGPRSMQGRGGWWMRFLR